MDDERLWTASELERLPLEQRNRVVQEGFVTDLSTLPSEFVERVRAKGRALLAERGSPPRDR